MKLFPFYVFLLLHLSCSREKSFVYIDLADSLSDSVTSGQKAKVLEMRIGNRKRKAILVPGAGSFRPRFFVPPNAKLIFSPMLPPGSWEKETEEVTFSVSIRTRGMIPVQIWEAQVSKRETNPGEVELDLSAYAGSAAEISFACRTNVAFDSPRTWGLWARPRVVSSVRPRGSSSLILITIDTLRADHLGCYGDTLAYTPNIDRLAARGTTFLNAYSNFDVTNPSLSTMLTGLYGRDHGVYDLRTPLPARFKTVAEILKGRGFSTGAVVSVQHMSPGLSGLAQGFDDYYAPSSGEWTADVVTEIASTWLERNAQSPFFLWIHYFDPHMLFSPPEELAERFFPGGPQSPGRRNLADSLASLTDLEHLGPAGRAWLSGISNPDYPEAMYRAEIAFVDQQIRYIMQTISNLLLESKTLIVLTSDHGESMGEHGIYYDHIGLYRQQLHIPLIFYAPGLIPSGERREDLISTVDLLPTILDLLSMAPNLETGGFSFAPSIFRGSPGERSLVIAQHADNRAATMRTKSWSFIRAWLPYSVVHVDTLLFDLEEDPEEVNDIMYTDLRGPKMLAELQDWMDRVPVFTAKPASIDERTREELLSMGYIVKD